MIYKLMTKWRDKELVCCRPIANQCLKNHDCEELEFELKIYGDLEECMREYSYERGKGGAIKQKR